MTLTGNQLWIRYTKTQRNKNQENELRNKADLAAKAAASLGHMEQLVMAVILAQQKQQDQGRQEKEELINWCHNIFTW